MSGIAAFQSRDKDGWVFLLLMGILGIIAGAYGGPGIDRETGFHTHGWG